jgi:hypothetical protein
MIKRGTSRLDLYIDGFLVAQDTSISSTGTLSNSGDLTIGRYQDAAVRYFPGLIDEAKIYNYALTAEQIKNIMNQSSAYRIGPNTGSP